MLFRPIRLYLYYTIDELRRQAVLFVGLAAIDSAAFLLTIAIPFWRADESYGAVASWIPIVNTAALAFGLAGTSSGSPTMAERLPLGTQYAWAAKLSCLFLLASVLTLMSILTDNVQLRVYASYQTAASPVLLRLHGMLLLGVWYLVVVG